MTMVTKLQKLTEENEKNTRLIQLELQKAQAKLGDKLAMVEIAVTEGEIMAAESIARWISELDEVQGALLGHLAYLGDINRITRRSAVWIDLP